MMFTSLLFAVVWLSVVALSSPTAMTSGNPSKLSKNNSSKVIAVGKGSFTFTPGTITADPGDEIVFQFWSDGHSVARSEFGFPCMPYEYIMPDKTGFWSGDMLDVTPDSHPTFSITVNDTKPIFFYCSSSNSCKENKMIGVINPNNTWTLEKQESFINPRVLELRPGDPFPSESNKAEPTQAGGEHAHENSSTSIGDIVGIAIGSIAVILLAGVLVYICRRQSRIQKEREQNTTTDKNTLPLTNESSPEISDDTIPMSPPPQNYPTLVLAQPTNSGQWSLTSPMTSPCQSSFQLNPPNILRTAPSETSLGYYPEHTRLEVPGSLVPVELPADDLHVPKRS